MAADAEVEQHGLLRPLRARSSPRSVGSATRTSPRSSIAIASSTASASIVAPESSATRPTIARCVRARSPASSLTPAPRVGSSSSRTARPARTPSSVGTIAIRTYPSPSGPKNDPGATTTPARSSRSSAHSSEGGRPAPRPTGRTSPRCPPRARRGRRTASRKMRALRRVARAVAPRRAPRRPRRRRDARCTNSCGVTPTLGRSRLSAAIKRGVAGREPAPVPGHRRALAERVDHEHVREVARPAAR